MAARLPILMFHDLGQPSSAVCMSPAVFRRGLRRLHESGRRTLGLGEAAAILRAGGPFPERSFVVTFDDGYRAVYDEALPILAELGMSATVFLTVGRRAATASEDALPSIGGRPMNRWLRSASKR